MLEFMAFAGALMIPFLIVCMVGIVVADKTRSKNREKIHKQFENGELTASEYTSALCRNDHPFKSKY